MFPPMPNISHYQDRDLEQQEPITHTMPLRPSLLSEVQSGVKSIEIRLFDEKRRHIKVGDSIEFFSTEDPSITCKKKIVALTHAKSFLELLQQVPLEKAGWPQGSLPEKAVANIRKYYSEEEEQKWGAVALYLE